ncbi:MAG: hypothetical protein K2X66_18775 [Cyanobacteria bacterium]|nr:hypothetical protein [Cyanobacteriota bacterium]
MPLFLPSSHSSRPYLSLRPSTSTAGGSALQFGRVDSPSDSSEEESEKLKKARENLIDVLKKTKLPTPLNLQRAPFGERLANFFKGWFEDPPPPLLLGKIKESDIKIGFPTHYMHFKKDGYFRKGILIPVDSDETKELIIETLGKSLGGFRPANHPSCPNRYYQYFNTPVEFVPIKAI